MTKRSTLGLGGGPVLRSALKARSARQCADALAELAELRVFRDEVVPALRGEWEAVVPFVQHWRELIGDVLQTASVAFPKLVRKVDDDFGILSADEVVRTEPVRYLDHLVTDVPFSPLVSCFGREVGIAVAAIEAVRQLLVGERPLVMDAACGWAELPAGADQVRFQRLADQALRAMAPPLVRVRELFDLTPADLGDLFGVSRQAVGQWERNGRVPAGRRATLADLLAVGELLERKLKAGRLPVIAQRPSAAYGGLTLLEMVKAGRVSELRELTERALDWSTAA